MGACRAPRVVWPALLVTLGGLASCNLVVGASDYKVGDASTPSSSGVANDSGTSGATSGSSDANVTSGSPSSGAADADGSEATSGSAGATSSDAATCSLDGLVDGACPATGQSGQSGSSGSSGSTPTPACGDAITANAARIQPLARACLLYVSCSATMIYNYASECVQYAWSRSYQERYGCLDGAQTCEDVFACASARPPTQRGECPARDATCDNNIAINCFEGGSTGYRTDCSLEHGVCRTYVDPSDGRTYAGCSPLGATCETTEGCAGNSYYACFGDVPIGGTCGNEVCGLVNGKVGCGMPRPACTDASVVSCADRELSICSVENKRFTVPCSALGLSCTSANDITECLDPACQPSDHARCRESCRGSFASLCVGGATVQVDCKELGFTKCAELLADESTSAEGMFENYVRCAN